MGKLSRHMYLIPAALLLGLMLTIVLDTPTPVCATCGSTMHAVRSKHTDRQTSDTKNGVTTDTEQTTTITVVVGDQGDVFTENSTSNKNSDGSSESHEKMHAEDPEGCDENGEPWKGDLTIDNTSDAKGNRKRHTEQIIEKNGKCIKNVRDLEWNKKGEVIKDTGWVETEVPCGKWNLKADFEVTHPTGGGISEYRWGPNTVTIPLQTDGKTHKGSYTANIDVRVISQACSIIGILPILYNVTAKEDEFGDLDFTVQQNWSPVTGWGCSGLPNIPVTWTNTFTLKAEDGATKTFTIQDAGGGQVTYTYTLKKR